MGVAPFDRSKTPYVRKRLSRALPPVLPCVLARSGVSATLPRLWPAAPATMLVKLQTLRALTRKGTASGVRREHAARPPSPWPFPLDQPKGVRGPCILQGEPVGEFNEYAYQNNAGVPYGSRRPPQYSNPKGKIPLKTVLNPNSMRLASSSAYEMRIAMQSSASKKMTPVRHKIVNNMERVCELTHRPMSYHDCPQHNIGGVSWTS